MINDKMLDRATIDRINDLKILDVADKLGIKYSDKGNWRFASCFIHAEKTPSLGIRPARNRWKCFGCGHGGTHVDLVMQHEHLEYHQACEWLIREFDIPVPQQETRKTLLEAIKEKLMNTNNTQYLDQTLLDRFKGTSNEFTRAMVQSRILTMQQMEHAAERYHICTANEGVIFWQIDRDNNIREGKVMFYEADGHRSHSRKPISMSWLLKQENQLPEEWRATNCLFGLHLLAYDDDRRIAIVESEKTAIICSELLADQNFIWLATGGKNYLTIQSLQPLKGRKIIIFPDTDTTGSTYQDWLKIAQDASKQFGHPLTVSNLLELHATEDQKKQKIDIADFILASVTSH